MSAESVVAGPEVEMLELEPISSSLSSFGVDLDLNLGPSFALDLALGRGGEEEEEEEEETRRESFDGSTSTIATPPHVSRLHWSRFEPGMLAGTRVEEEDDEENFMREDHVSSSSSSLLTDEARRHQQEEVVSHDDDDGLLSVSYNRFDHGDGTISRDDSNHRGDGGEGSSQSPLLALRNPRHTRLPRRPRQSLFTPLRNVSQTFLSSEQEPMTENRIVLSSADASSTEDIFSGTRISGVQNSLLEIALSNENPNRNENNVKNKDQKNNSEGGGGVHFECNICLELAVEPVVTCCGHLFCWPCLHQWLHLHSSRKECPVCKGFLSDDVITPIYGRGTTESGDRSSGNNNTPARPHAHRINAKRRWQGRLSQDRLELQFESAEPEVSANASASASASASAELLILNRLRVAQRLQREHLDERLRLRLRQRMMGRRGSAFRSFSGLESVTRAMISPIPNIDSGGQVRNLPSENAGVQVQEQTQESTNVQVQNQTFESTDGQLSTQSLENVDESLVQNMERTLGSLPPSLFEERITPVGTRSYFLRANAGELGLFAPESSMLETGSPELGEFAFRSRQRREMEGTNVSPEAPQQHRSWRISPNSSSGSFDVEPGPSHARKRRRLN